MYFPCLVVQNLMKKLIVDTKRYQSQQYGFKPSFKINYGLDAMQVVALHHYPELVDQCCDLVNSEWKRSRTARMRSFESSCDKLPTNLVLVQEANVIGHSKLSVIPSMPDACFLESVVIDKELRGKGYGKYLMNRIEEHCRRIGLRMIFLSTKDKVEFYEKLGYDMCGPVSIYGQYVRTQMPSPVRPMPPNIGKNGSAAAPQPAPPPPPPPPELYNGADPKKKNFMSKVL